MKNFIFFPKISLLIQKNVVTLQPVLKIVFYMILENGKLGTFKIRKNKRSQERGFDLFANLGLLIPPMRIMLSPFFNTKNK